MLFKRVRQLYLLLLARYVFDDLGDYYKNNENTIFSEVMRCKMRLNVC